ncbi:MAG: hypothetical protein K0Q79_670 [Flavipsychrobacter sp.]|jgi:hypothetical protein|nr:hypothetical protein [Flavipsychrobacter sp.]
MNWKLVFSLSLFGLAMAIATVYWVPSTIEPFFWLIIFLICAYIVAKKAPGKYFLHGFMISIFNCVWITAAHAILSDTYALTHAQEAAQYEQMNSEMHINLSLKQAMLLTGPIIGIISGLVLGLFCFIASKIFRKAAM